MNLNGNIPESIMHHQAENYKDCDVKYASNSNEVFQQQELEFRLCSYPSQTDKGVGVNQRRLSVLM